MPEGFSGEGFDSGRKFNAELVEKALDRVVTYAKAKLALEQAKKKNPDNDVDYPTGALIDAMILFRSAVEAPGKKYFLPDGSTCDREIEAAAAWAKLADERGLK